MAIRIRVYPQPGSIGMRRNRMVRRQQAQFARQQLYFARLQQQQMLRAIQLPFGGYGSGFAPSAYPAYPPMFGGSSGAYGGYGYLGPVQAPMTNYCPPASSVFDQTHSAGFGGGWFRQFLNAF